MTKPTARKDLYLALASFACPIAGLIVWVVFEFVLNTSNPKIVSHDAFLRSKEALISTIPAFAIAIGTAAGMVIASLSLRISPRGEIIFTASIIFNLMIFSLNFIWLVEAAFYLIFVIDKYANYVS